MFFIYGVFPLLLCITIFSIYLLFSRYSWRQRFNMLGVFVTVSAIIGVITYVPGEAAHWFSFLMWVAPPFAVKAFARRLVQE